MSSQGIKMLSGMGAGEKSRDIGAFGGFPGESAGQGLVRPDYSDQFKDYGLTPFSESERTGEGKGELSGDAAVSEELLRAVRRRQQMLNYDMKRSMRVDKNKAREILKQLVRVTLAAPQTTILIKKAKHVTRIVDEFFEDPYVVTFMARIAVHDHTTQMHLVNVMLYCMGYACQTGQSIETVKAYGLAGLLHDVGKLFIPDYLLNAPRELTRKEKVKIRKHTRTGFKLLESKAMNQEVLAAVLDHHERLDGSGYPQGKTNGSLGEMARVLAIVDVFDALTTKRAYRRPMKPLTALKQIREEVRARRLDRDIFSKFARSVVGMTAKDIRAI
ncbi:MAG: HD domain-containing protein [Desulfobacterales bacterium]|nr:HD domain-containing protein [Desulfobacterales bacterium]